MIINNSNLNVDKSVPNKLIELSRWIITIQNISLKFSHHLPNHRYFYFIILTIDIQISDWYQWF